MTGAVRRLADLWATVKQEYPVTDYDAWEASPFRGLKFEPSSSRKGAMAKRLVEKWCIDRGFVVQPRDTAGFDRKIEGHRFQVKLSTQWEQGFYEFQQIRDQPYDYLFCLGISPLDAHAWIVSKEAAFGNCVGQHTGATGTDTRWFRCEASAPPEWLADCGGALDQAFQVLKSLGSKVDTSKQSGSGRG